MKLLKPVILVLLFMAFSVNGQDSVKCSNKRFYLDVSIGKGGQVYLQPGPSDQYDYRLQNIGPSDPDDPTIISGISLINSEQISFGYRLVNKDCRIRKGVEHFIYVGAGFSNLNYQMYVANSNYSRHELSHSYNYEFDPGNMNLKISKINSSLFFTMGAVYPKGFYISNSIGFGYSAYLNKKETSFNEYITYSGIESSPDSVTTSNPGGYYFNSVTTRKIIKLKNYGPNSFFAFYSLNLGYRIKNIVPYISAEMNLVNGYLTSIYIFKGGLRILL